MKAIQNSVLRSYRGGRGWASRDPHPSTSGTVPGPYRTVRARPAARGCSLHLTRYCDLVSE
eukprot:6358153-Prymnesium_polylepis.1